MTDLRFGPKFQFFAGILICSNIISYSAFSFVYCFFESSVGHSESDKPVGYFVSLSCPFASTILGLFLFSIFFLFGTSCHVMQACLELVNSRE